MAKRAFGVQAARRFSFSLSTRGRNALAESVYMLSFKGRSLNGVVFAYRLNNKKLFCASAPHAALRRSSDDGVRLASKTVSTPSALCFLCFDPVVAPIFRALLKQKLFILDDES